MNYCKGLSKVYKKVARHCKNQFGTWALNPKKSADERMDDYCNAMARDKVIEAKRARLKYGYACQSNLRKYQHIHKEVRLTK